MHKLIIGSIAFVGALVGTDAHACGMPMRMEHRQLVVQIQRINALPVVAVTPVVPTLQEQLTETIDARRAALALAVGAQVAPIVMRKQS